MRPNEDAAPGESSLVSCVIIVRDGERFLAEAIESVIAQSHHDWELIIVDDGSRDRTDEVAREFQSRMPGSISILHHPGRVNRGKSVSRNLGVRHSKGAFVALLDADDVWLPNKLKAQLDSLRRYPDAAMTFGPVRYWYSWTGRPQDSCRDLVSRIGFPPDTLVAPPAAVTALLRAEARREETLSPYPSALLFRREVFDRVGGFEPDFRLLYDDVIFFAKAMSLFPVFVSGQVTTNYRLHPDAVMSNSFEEARAEGNWAEGQPNAAECAFLDRTRAFLGREKIRNVALRRALARCERPYRYPRLHHAISLGGSVRRKVFRFCRRLLRIDRPSGTRIPAGQVRWGDLGRRPIATRAEATGRGGWPLDAKFGAFLARHAADLTGDVAEVGDDTLVRRYSASAQSVTVIPYFEIGGTGKSAARKFDCIVARDLLRFCEDPQARLRRIRARLKPGGRLLLSLTTVAAVDSAVRDRWRFTEEGTKALFQRLGGFDVTAESVGNISIATAVFHGMGIDDLPGGSLGDDNPSFALEVYVRAVRA